MAADLSPQARAILAALDREAGERRAAFEPPPPVAEPSAVDPHEARLTRLMDEVTGRARMARGRLDTLNAELDHLAGELGVELPARPAEGRRTARELRAAFGGRATAATALEESIGEAGGVTTDDLAAAAPDEHLEGSASLPRGRELLAGLPPGLAAAAIAPPAPDAPLDLPPRAAGHGTGIPARQRRPAPVPEDLRDDA